MQNILTHLSLLRGDRKGVTTIEYAILAFAIIGVVVGVVAVLGGELSNAFGTVGSRLTSAVST